MEPRSDYRSRPPQSWRTFFEVDSLRLLKFKLSGLNRKVYGLFKSRALAGTQCPDVALTTTDGRTVRTGDFFGKKHLVIVFGAIT